ncbi:hypothetical protein GXB81_00630 [Paraburkholderia sp. Ac-20336]|nr:hypothetical protein [Paraburkholderia sp. Ac-20336]MBN3846593.1 hypothetical protein [Paraburkholderia sp. Ac-20342]
MTIVEIDEETLAIGLDIYMPESDQTSPDKVADNLSAPDATLATALRALPSHDTILAASLRAAPTQYFAACLRSKPSRNSATLPLRERSRAG